LNIENTFLNFSKTDGAPFGQAPSAWYFEANADREQVDVSKSLPR
jgi:hypothetical protein